MILKKILVVFGFISLILGIIGTLLPIMPTIPFLFVAYICFSKGSDRFRNWYLHSSFHKQYLRAMAAPLRYKIMYVVGVICFFIALGTACYIFRDTVIEIFNKGMNWIEERI